MEKPMSKSDSLAIISEMIEATKDELKGSHFYFLFWGWLAIAIHAAHYYLMAYTDFAHPEMVWALAAFGGIYTAIYSAKRKKAQRITTHFDKVIGYVWMAYGFTVLIVIGAGGSLNYAIYPLVTLLTAFPTFLTGILTKYKPLVYGGSLFWIFAVVSFAVNPQNQIIVGAIALACGYLVPAYMMKNSK
ncbi:MAG: hypothetical protein ABJN36_09230 [Cyclobacteriaceae bacterium]